ncbi:unnamed protein product, partial [Didymodactylos carnosus]
YSTELNDDIEQALDKLCQFLNEVTPPLSARLHNTLKLNSKLITTTAITTTTTNTNVNENQQYLISLDSRIKISPGLLQQNNDTDTDRWCKLLNIFNKQLPLSSQILWGSAATDSAITLYF